ncbi:MAG: purine-nucleoside phosphorylase [Rhodospirillales bacterium]|nr:purine-nucleoside phosphorylase [Rhodospirillales bacterium]
MSIMIQQSAEIIRKAAPALHPKIAVMLGSGLGAVADLLDETAALSYSALPGFPVPTVKDHEGSLRTGHVAGVPVIFLKGRQHFYEGAGFDGLKIMIRTLKALGVDILILTNAAGSLMPENGPGSVVSIKDHINLLGSNPLTGANDDDWGPRFVDMGDAWDKRLRGILQDCAKKSGSRLDEGIYAAMPGPAFETPAEISMLKTIGADLVGMSTVPENLIARHCGIKCVGLSAVTNMAAGMSDEILTHAHTIANAERAQKDMATLIETFVQEATKA